MQQEIAEVGDVKNYPLGTIYQDSRGAFRYGQAGTELKKRHRVYANARRKDLHYKGSLLLTEDVNDLIWGNLSATGPKGTELGAAVVDVRQGQYCWVRVR